MKACMMFLINTMSTISGTDTSTLVFKHTECAAEFMMTLSKTSGKNDVVSF